MSFDRLIRFCDQTGATFHGNVTDSSGEIIGSEVEILSGNVGSGFSHTGEKKIVSKLLCPIEHIPIIQCIGANYRKHAAEANYEVPTQPVVFSKPADTATGHLDEIHVHDAAKKALDYEGELCFVIGKDCKNVSEEEALDYILGYTIGNDLSARDYAPHNISGSQMGYGKSFDGFAPLGPSVVASSIIKDPQTLHLETKVNGETRQNESTGDMIWTVRQIIAHLSRGRTLRAGTIVMTGTPSGVAWGMKNPKYLQNGDIVEISISEIGSLRNTIIF